MNKLLTALIALSIGVTIGYALPKNNKFDTTCAGIVKVGGDQGYICQVVLGQHSSNQQEIVRVRVPGLIPSN